MPRPYRLKRRAKRQEETRQKIVEAAVELHGTVGPAQTSISAIAERAGVQRVTVYRHFPDEQSLFQACSGHFNADNPPPDPAPWAEIDDPAVRLRVALGEIYAFYRRTEAMMTNVLRDMVALPALAEAVSSLLDYLEHVRDALAQGWSAPASQKPLLLAAIGHALDFQTWRSLTRQHGLDDAQAVDIMVRLATAVARDE
jgi:AcrR family transcriptional regulator